MKAITYEDVLLVPKYSDIESRAEVSLASNLSDTLKLEVPIFAAPMDTVSGVDMAVGISKLGGCAIIHRYNTIPAQVDMVREAKRNGAIIVGAAVGATGDFDERAKYGLSASAAAKLSAFNSSARPRYIKCRETVASMMKPAASAPQQEARGDALQSVERTEALMAEIQKKGIDIYSTP